MNNRAIFINSLAAGGAEKVVSSLANSDGFDSDIILIWPEQFFELSTISPKVLLNKKGFLLFDLILASLHLFQLVKKEGYTSINSHLFWSNYLNVIVSFFSRHTTICTHCVSFVSKFSHGSFLRYIHFFLIKSILRFADMHTYKSIEMKVEYEKIFGLNNGVVIFNPINLKVITQKSEACVDFKFLKDKTYILSVGRFHKTKNQIQLIKALVYLEENVEIIFLGDGCELLNCKDLAVNLGVSERVHFLGAVDNPYPYFKKCDIYLSSSLSEGFPNTLIEALALSCYPLHMDCKTGPREIISNLFLDDFILSRSGYEWFDLGVLILEDDINCICSAVNFYLNNKPKLCDDKLNRLLGFLDERVISTQYRSIHNK